MAEVTCKDLFLVMQIPLANSSLMIYSPFLPDEYVDINNYL